MSDARGGNQASHHSFPLCSLKDSTQCLPICAGGNIIVICLNPTGIRSRTSCAVCNETGIPQLGPNWKGLIGVYLLADTVLTVPVSNASIGMFLPAISRAIVIEAGPHPNKSNKLFAVVNNYYYRR